MPEQNKQVNRINCPSALASMSASWLTRYLTMSIFDVFSIDVSTMLSEIIDQCKCKMTIHNTYNVAKCSGVVWLMDVLALISRQSKYDWNKYVHII